MEELFGYDAAVKVDINVWKKYAKIEVRRINKNFKIKTCGIPAIIEIFKLSPTYFSFKYEVPVLTEKRAVLRVTSCPPLQSMERANRSDYVCESVGTVYFSSFAKAVEPRTKVRCLKIPPRSSSNEVCCEWEFELEDHQKGSTGNIRSESMIN